jgi:hypothetical protein
MGPRDRREVVLAIEPGEEFSPETAKRAIAEGDHEVKVLTYLDDELSGGMTYPLSFDVQEGDGERLREEETVAHSHAEGRLPPSEEILKILEGRLPVVSGPNGRSRIRTVRLELDLDYNE